MENEEEVVKTKKKISFKAILISVLILIMIITVISAIHSGGNDSGVSSGASEGYVKECSEEFILRYYPLLYPDTFKIKSIKYSKTSYKDNGYELWCTEGYFTSESKVGLEIKTNYKIYMQYKFSDDKCHILWLKIDNKTYYGSYDKVNELT